MSSRTRPWLPISFGRPTSPTLKVIGLGWLYLSTILGMGHVRGAPSRPQTQGKIERGSDQTCDAQKVLATRSRPHMGIIRRRTEESRHVRLAEFSRRVHPVAATGEDNPSRPRKAKTAAMPVWANLT